MSKHLDLDALREARAEASGEKPTVKLGGTTYELPAELPWAVVEAASTNEPSAIVNAIKTMLGEQWADFEKHNLSAGDMTALIEHIGQMYGDTLGKA